MKIYFSKNSINNFLKYIEDLAQLSSSNRWIFDKDALELQINEWNNKLPWIKPYYAIKSNPSEKVLKILTNYGDKIGIDTASIQEVNIALKYKLVSISNPVLNYNITDYISYESSTRKAPANRATTFNILDSASKYVYFAIPSASS